MNDAVSFCDIWKKEIETNSVVCQFKSTFGHSGHYYLLNQFNNPETNKNDLLNAKRLKDCVKKSSYAHLIG